MNTLVLWLLNQNENIQKLAKENASKQERVNNLCHSLYFVKIAEEENCHSNSAKTAINNEFTALMDNRHTKRLHTIQNLYALCFEADEEKRSIPHKDDESTSQILKNLETIDQHIQDHAPKYPIDKISKIDISILRLAVYELLIEKKEPMKVIINEAIELAKELGNDRSYSFVNAVLGSLNTEVTTPK